jgi:predicted phosphodiesterase
MTLIDRDRLIALLRDRFVPVAAVAAISTGFGGWGLASTGDPAMALVGLPPAYYPVGHQPTRCERSVPDGHLFLFATIADSHIRSQPIDSPKYIKATSISCELLANYVADINAHVPTVDFAVHLGDITDFGLNQEFDAARDILDSLRCPLYPIVGNHDNFQYDAKRGWMEFAGIDSTWYSFDYMGFHFIAIDCTRDRYHSPFVECSKPLLEWVRKDLSRNREKPTFILSHYNMWQRSWNARFDTTMSYTDYPGMVELRHILEHSGNVAAFINGHVHANRVEVHNGIYYIDIGATLVGPPSIRYFYVFADSIIVTYEYISDCSLFRYVVSLGQQCADCFDAGQVADYIDGEDSDKEFSIPCIMLHGHDRDAYP